MLLELLAREREKIVRRKKCFGRLCKILGRIAHSISPSLTGRTVAEPLLDPLVTPRFLRPFESLLNLWIRKAGLETLVMISMSQFVECKVRHPPILRLENPYIRKLHSLGHRRISAMLLQPTGPGMVLRPGLLVGVNRRKPQRNPLELGDTITRNDADDLLELLLKNLQGQLELGGLGLVLDQFPTDMELPSEQLLLLIAPGGFLGLRGRRL